MELNYDHYIGIDWAKTNMAIARMTKHSNKIEVIDVVADLEELKIYLKNKKGKKILTFEETSTAQWLYTELNSYVDKILVCNPHRNKLLSDGPKTDKIDAKKLVQLLRADLLKPVYHSGNFYLSLRKLASGYEDLVKQGVRTKNQRSALFIAVGKSKKTKDLDGTYEKFVLEGLDGQIKNYEQEKKRYEQEFKKLSKNNRLIRNLKTIPGIGCIWAVRLSALVVDASRFKHKDPWLSYCGLVKLDKVSGGRNYGKRSPRYSRIAKSIFKIAALTVLTKDEKSSLKKYYLDLIEEKNYPEYLARHSLARRIAIITLGVFKQNKPYKQKEVKLIYKSRMICS